MIHLKPNPRIKTKQKPKTFVQKIDDLDKISEPWMVLKAPMILVYQLISDVFSSKQHLCISQNTHKFKFSNH